MSNGRAKKFLYDHGGRFLPSLFTLGNAFFGFASIALAFEGERIAAAYCIFLAAMMDALDGRVARLMKVESDFGLELDSLCDAVSFCLAPACLAYVWYLRPLGFFGILVAALFLMAGLFRLARFNLIHDEQLLFFMGMPTTIAGCFLVTFLLNISVYCNEAPTWGIDTSCGTITFVSALLILVLAWLMVSTVRFPTFKEGTLQLKKHYHVVAAIGLFSIMAVMRFQLALLLLFMGYFVAAFGYRFKDDLKGAFHE